MTTLVLPISRTGYLKPVFDCLNALEKPEDTELLIITDGELELSRAIDRRLDQISYRRIRVISFGDAPAESIKDRRLRISAIHNKARYHIPEDCEYVLSIEDDTVYPPKTLSELLLTMTTQPTAAFVQGVELGRHNTPYVGGWLADDCYNPSSIESVMPVQEIQEIQAGGLYCALIDADLYKQHYFEPFADFPKGLSCDLNFGLYLVQQGYTCWMDWSIQCDHIGVKGSVNLGNTKPVKVLFERQGDAWTLETLTPIISTYTTNPPAVTMGVPRKKVVRS